MAAFQLFLNVPVLGVLNVSAAEAFAYQDALIPIEAFATAIAIGSGIVASQSQAAIDGASEMLRKAVASMKAKACLDSETEFRVIDGGKPRKPKKGDDKNNKKWFTIGAGAVATGSLIAGLKASREMMQEIYDVNGYEKINKVSNVVSIDDVANYMSFTYIKNQCIDSHIPGMITQINNIENYITRNGFKLSDYLYSLSLETLPTENEYGSVKLNAIKKSNIKYYQPTSFSIQNNKYNSAGVEFNGYNFNPEYIGNFKNEDLVNVSNQLVTFVSFAYSHNGSPIVSNSYEYSHYKYEYSPTCKIGFGFIGGTVINYDLTNQIYNNSQTQEINFPDWLQQSIETLNGNLTGLNLAINNLQLPQTWNDTQTNIQTGTAPSNVINQYINNWSNPEQAPDPEPDPGPNPDPEPEPDPDPGEQPAAEAAVEESGKALFDWAIAKITLPDGFFDKLPFSIPYDIYLLLRSLFPSGKSSARRVYSFRSAANVGETDPNGLTITSNYEAAGISTKTHSNKWVKTAPVINIDIHWKYHGVDGSEKTIDIVKKVDLSSISYFAMIIYISIYVFWFFELLGWIMSSFKG